MENIEYVDKRGNGGCLWMVGGEELEPVAKQHKKLGYKFTYKEKGGKAIDKRPGWWL